MRTLYWDAASVSPEIATLLETLGTAYPLREISGGDRPAAGDLMLRFMPSGDCEEMSIVISDATATVTYGRTAGAARGVAYALAGVAGREKLTFDTFSILLDASRTGIVTPSHMRQWLLKLALFGVNQAMIYTKDAYQLPDEPYFGYMRGAYSMEEIREIDAFAAKLGIEIVASIQALGHLEPILRWPAYYEVKDTDNVIMPGDEKALQLVGKMIEFWSAALGSRRIHLGMDETHDLGRGRYQDIHGYKAPFALYVDHLNKVCAICRDYGMKPIIWGDMFIRMANARQDAYDVNCSVPPEVVKAIPADVQIAYWDYYHQDSSFYSAMFNRYRAMGKEPLMASGLWTWVRLWYDHQYSLARVKPCIDSCRKEGVREIIFTMWGDDGGYCEFDSVFCGMAWAADYAFNGGSDDEERIAAIFQAVCGTSYAEQIAVGDLDWHGSEFRYINAAMALWDDPLMGIVWNENPAAWPEYLCKLRNLREKIAGFGDGGGGGRMAHGALVCDVLIAKIDFRLRLLNAYRNGDRAQLLMLAAETEQIIGKIKAFGANYRELYLRSFKVWGLEIMQIRLSGLCERYREVARRLRELPDDGGIMPELEVVPPDRNYQEFRYRMVSTGGWFI